MAEARLHAAQAHPVVAQRRRADLRGHGDEPTVDPLADRLGLGRDEAAVVHRLERSGERLLREPLRAEPALGALAPSPGCRVAPAVHDVGPGLTSLVNVPSQAQHGSNREQIGKSRSAPRDGPTFSLVRRARTPKSNLYAPEGAGGFKPRLRRPGRWSSSVAIA